jgi:hypothetical protein
MRLVVTQKLDDKMIQQIQNKLGSLCELDNILAYIEGRPLKNLQRKEDYI